MSFLSSLRVNSWTNCESNVDTVMETPESQSMIKYHEFSIAQLAASSSRKTSDFKAGKIFLTCIVIVALIAVFTIIVVTAIAMALTLEL